MPWSTGDVDEHKKGLSPEQKKKWVDIANGVLKSCLAKKGKNCDAMAIRVANSKVTSNLEMNTIQNNFLTQDYVPTIVERNGTQYYVVPVVMMVEGVHNGSHGPIYHSIDELGKIPESWNGIPVTIGHPFNEYGEFVSANSPDILEEWAVGTVFNTSVDGNKLRAEVWLETKRLQEVSFETLRSIQMGKMMEVSVGIFLMRIIKKVIGMVNIIYLRLKITNLTISLFCPERLVLVLLMMAVVCV